MKATVFLLVLLCLPSNVTSGSWIRDIQKFVCRSVCSSTCVTVTSCPACKPVCDYGCKKACRKKRETQLPNTFTLLLPCKFEAWDTDRNGQISEEEFSFAGHTEYGKHSKIAFGKCDRDGNGKISKEEFEDAPLVKEKC